MNDTMLILPSLKLRLNITYPNLEECYVDGYDCACAELNENENPFQEGTVEFEHWQEGWWAGFYGEKPLFTLDELDSNINKPVKHEQAANESYFLLSQTHLYQALVVIGAIAASAMVGYQLIELVV